MSPPGTSHRRGRLAPARRRTPAKSWRRKRRVIIKAEVVRHPGRAPKSNARFVITNLAAPPEAVYGFYCGRGGVEKRLVIKRIRRERASDPRFVAMFVEEARLSRALVHKHIVPVFDFGRAGDELFLAMELVDGPDLDAILRQAREQDTRLSPMLVAYIALEACHALEHAHHASAPDGTPRPLVHRDVTPRNVLVSGWSRSSAPTIT